MPDSAPVLLKKYGNRRLYDTDRSAYVTLADVAEMVKRGVNIEVVDAKTGENLTRTILLQIIMEHQKSRIELLPIAFLRQIITYREDTLREYFDKYLETSLAAFASAETQVARKFRDGFETFIGGMMGGAARVFPFNVLGGTAAKPAAKNEPEPPPPEDEEEPPAPEPEEAAPPDPTAPKEPAKASVEERLLSRLEDLERRLAERERQQDEEEKPRAKKAPKKR